MATIIFCITGSIAAISTYLVSEKLKQGAVRASAGLSLLVAVFFFLFADYFSEYYTTHIPSIFFGASFAGMVSSRVLSKLIFIGISGAIFPVIYTRTASYFSGFGGSLGTTACISFIIALALYFILQQRKKSTSR